jgi:hypothetical protein
VTLGSARDGRRGESERVRVPLVGNITDVFVARKVGDSGESVDR